MENGSPKQFYINWCLDRNPKFKSYIEDHAESDGMEEIFTIMDSFLESVLLDIVGDLDNMIMDGRMNPQTAGYGWNDAIESAKEVIRERINKDDEPKSK